MRRLSPYFFNEKSLVRNFFDIYILVLIRYLYIIHLFIYYMIYKLKLKKSKLMDIDQNSKSCREYVKFLIFLTYF